MNPAHSIPLAALLRWRPACWLRLCIWYALSEHEACLAQHRIAEHNVRVRRGYLDEAERELRQVACALQSFDHDARDAGLELARRRA